MSNATLIVLIVGGLLVLLAVAILLIDLRAHPTTWNALKAEPAAFIGLLPVIAGVADSLFGINSPAHRYIALGVAALSFLTSRAIRSQVTPPLPSTVGTAPAEPVPASPWPAHLTGDSGYARGDLVWVLAVVAVVLIVLLFVGVIHH